MMFQDTPQTVFTFRGWLDLPYLAYRTGQSLDLTVIGNPILILSRVSFSHLVINGTNGINGAYLLFRRL